MLTELFGGLVAYFIDQWWLFIVFGAPLGDMMQANLYFDG